MLIPAFSVLFIGLIGLCIVTCLILLPASPRTYWLFLPWLALLTVMVWVFVTEFVSPGDASNPIIPLRSLIIQGLCLFLPFAVSLGLWAKGIGDPDWASERRIVTIVICATVLCYGGLMQFNKACVSPNYLEQGGSLCSSSWHALPAHNKE